MVAEATLWLETVVGGEVGEMGDVMCFGSESS